jgi:chromosome segregation ATPase
MAVLALQALAWYAAALSLTARQRELLAEEPAASSTPVPFRSLQDEIDELSRMLEKQFEEDEDAVESVLKKANETEATVEEAYNESDALSESVTDGEVNISSKNITELEQNIKTLTEELEKSAKANKNAKKEMADFKETAHERLTAMKERAKGNMEKYRELAEMSATSLDHARELEKNLTAAHEVMTVAKDTIRASSIQSKEAFELLEEELDGIRTTSSTPVPRPGTPGWDPSVAWVGAGMWVLVLSCN